MCHEGATLPFRDTHMYVEEETNKVDRAKSKPCICSELTVVITRGSQTVTAKSIHAACSLVYKLPTAYLLCVHVALSTLFVSHCTVTCRKKVYFRFYFT
jgi:hypothetical protein